MGRFAAVMKSVLRALGKTGLHVWERCERTGMILFRAMTAPVEALLYGTADGHMLVPFSTEETFEDNFPLHRGVESSDIKRLAAKIIASDVEERDVCAVPERILRWMTVMNKRELSRIIGATHHQLESHVYGHKKMEGVLEFRKSAVDARAEELAKQELADREERKERKLRMEESERLMREIEYRRERSRRADEEFELEHGHPRLGYGV